MVAAGLLSPPGRPATPGELRASLAAQACRYAASPEVAYVRLVEARQTDEEDVLVLDLDVQRPSVLAHDIRDVERVAALFPHDEREPPDVLSLRADFPAVPHLNLRTAEWPRSLCLYDRPYAELRPRLTGRAVVDRTREWLAQTARGELHGADQPLEPLLLPTRDVLVLPADFSDGDAAEVKALALTGRTDARGVTVLRASDPAREFIQGGVPALLLAQDTPPRIHGVIRHLPTTLQGLAALVRTETGADILGRLRGQLGPLLAAGEADDRQAVLVLALPKLRAPHHPVEGVEWRAFLLGGVRALGEDLGVWQPTGGALGLLLPHDQGRTGAGTALVPVNVNFDLTRAAAAMLNGVPPYRGRVTAVGAGALGSQVVANLVRAGWGEWTVIDDDVLLPHNLARHALFGHVAGVPKPEALALYLNHTLGGAPIVRPLAADVLRPGARSAEVGGALAASEVVLDLAASVTVGRHLALAPFPARRASVFLNPAGRDLAVLVEDAARTVRLDHLEFQYYQLLLDEPELAGHLRGPDGRTRYGLSCRDVSSTVAHDDVAEHAARASRVLKTALASPGATLRVWARGADEEVPRVYARAARPMQELAFGDWTLVADPRVVECARELREAALPDETGGTLVGGYDLTRRRVYVTALLPSPPDSGQAPHGYERGVQGLGQAFDEVNVRSAGLLEYVGEWHTHPRGHNSRPSAEDRTLFAWLEGHLGLDGLPPLMLIVAEDHTWYLGLLPEADGWT